MIIHDISLNHIVLYQLGVVNMIRPLIIDNVFPVLSKFRNASQAIHHWFFWGYPVLAYTMQVHKASSYWLPLLRLLRVLRPWDPCISQQRCFEQVDHGRTLKGPSVHQISQETHHLRSIPHLQVSPCGETAGGASAARYAQLASDDQWWLYDTVDTESPFVQVLFRSDLRWTEFGLLRWPWDAMGCQGMPGDARGRGNHLPGKLPFTWIHWHQWEVGRSSKIPLNKNIFHQKYITQLKVCTNKYDRGLELTVLCGNACWEFLCSMFAWTVFKMHHSWSSTLQDASSATFPSRSRAIPVALLC